MADLALAVEDGYLDPGIVRAEAGRPDDGRDPATAEGQVEARRLLDPGRREAVRGLDLAVEAVLGHPPVDGIEQPSRLEVGQGALVAQRARELEPAAARADE